MGGNQRAEGLVVTGLDDLVDLAIGLLVVEVMDLQLVDVPAVSLSLHIALVPSHGSLLAAGRRLPLEKKTPWAVGLFRSPCLASSMSSTTSPNVKMETGRI
jgi:hypothetical protein